MTGTPPAPVDWYLDPTFEKNTCFFSPRGFGQTWQNWANNHPGNPNTGCHNPRLDIDNIQCNTSQTDPDKPGFCAPENINVDFPPDKQWMRIGVFYFNNWSIPYDLHPTVRIFCNGTQAGEFGASGFASTVTFAPSDGAGSGGNQNVFWEVADVAFIPSNGCGQPSSCVVSPIYSDPTTLTAYLTTRSAAEASFDPPYPAPLP
jgi:hypothetical protein